jgi:O-antigen ligase/tetratricopeptide (TPR) repeat protein
MSTATTRRTAPAWRRRSAPSPGGPAAAGHALEPMLTRCVDAGLAVVVFVVPLVLGGRMALGQLILVAAVLWTALCWCLRQSLASRAEWVRSPAEPVLVAALAWVALQLASLPPAWLEALSATHYERLPLWAPGGDGAARLGLWRTISLDPAATRAGLVLLGAFVLLFWVTLQRVRRVEDVERLVRWIAWAAVAAACFGLVQHYLGNGKYFWCFEYPRARSDTDLLGTFTNRNHFAHFLALGAGPLLWWLASGLKRDGNPAGRRPFFPHTSAGPQSNVVFRAVALGLVVFAVPASLSRGGTAALAVALGVGVTVLYAASMIRRKTFILLGTSAAVLAGCLAAFGYEPIRNRLDDFESVDTLDPAHGRRNLWAADLKAVGESPLVGAGLGTHVEVFPLHLPNIASSQKTDYTHAENGYVQVALETGLPGLLLALGAAGLFAFWCVATLRRGLRDNTATGRRSMLCLAAVAPALAASLVHSLADFVWYVPGLMTVVVILGACACRLWQGVGEPDAPARGRCTLPRAGWLGAAALLLLLGPFMASNRFAAACAEPAWNRYVLDSEALADRDATDRRATLHEIADQLSTVVRWQPDHARAHLELAAVHRELFSEPASDDVCPIDVRQVREAVLASRFATSQAMYDWLGRAFGPRCRHLQAVWHHAREAVAHCPLLGRAYLCLADVSFLEGPTALAQTAYVDQAIRVRPHDGTVLFAAGQEAMLAGDPDAALRHWKASFQCGRAHQRRLLDALDDQIPVAELLRIFEPGWEAVRYVHYHYQKRNRPAEMKVVWRYYAESAERQAASLQGSPSATAWLAAARGHGQTGNSAQQRQCLERAVQCDPANYEAHRRLASVLLADGSPELAEKHLKWCLHHKPGDEEVKAKLERVVERRLRRNSQNPQEGPR